MQLLFPHAINATLKDILGALVSIKGERDQRSGDVSRRLQAGLHEVFVASKNMEFVRGDVQSMVGQLADWVMQLGADERGTHVYSHSCPASPPRQVCS